MGLEPISSVLETDILPIELSPHMERVGVIETPSLTWKDSILPLNYTRMVLAYGYNPFPRWPQHRVLSLHQSRYMYIKQNISNTYYLLSAETLSHISWSAEPHRFLSTGTNNTI